MTHDSTLQPTHSDLEAVQPALEVDHARNAPEALDGTAPEPYNNSEKEPFNPEKELRNVDPISLGHDSIWHTKALWYAIASIAVVVLALTVGLEVGLKRISTLTRSVYCLKAVILLLTRQIAPKPVILYHRHQQGLYTV